MIPQFDGFRRLRSVQLPDERYSTIDLMSDQVPKKSNMVSRSGRSEPGDTSCVPGEYRERGLPRAMDKRHRGCASKFFTRLL
jgi:hypothetical protein